MHGISCTLSCQPSNFQDEHRKNEWKLAERSRPFEPFDDETIVETEIIRDEFAANVAKVYNEQGNLLLQKSDSKIALTK